MKQRIRSGPREAEAKEVSGSTVNPQITPRARLGIPEKNQRSSRIKDFGAK